MADIVNERDLILSRSVRRTIVVDPPNAVVIPGYTGILLSASSSFWGWYGAGRFPPVHPNAVQFTAVLRGIPATQVVGWTSNVPLTDTADQLVKFVESANYPLDLRATQITVSVQYGGQTFTASVTLGVITG